jgi:SAM-dependent methyltransferase
MKAPTTRKCLVCGNDNVSMLQHIEDIGEEKRIQCGKCEAIYFTRTPDDLQEYNTNYNAYFFRPGDISKAGIMAGKIGDFCRAMLKAPMAIEAGMGNGLTVFLLNQQGIPMEGVDIDRIWTNYIGQKYNIEVHVTPFEKFVPRHSYNLVYSSHTIEHTENPIGFVKKAYEILEPGGYFWLETPDAYFAKKQRMRWHHFETRHPHEHLCILSIYAIEKIAKATDFKIFDWGRQPLYDSIKVILKKPD